MSFRDEIMELWNRSDDSLRRREKELEWAEMSRATDLARALELCRDEKMEDALFMANNEMCELWVIRFVLRERSLIHG